MSSDDTAHKLYSLTARQIEVLKLVCDGDDYQQIAEILFISVNTVKSHMANIYVKLGLDTLDATLRRKMLYQDYCAALQEIDIPPEKPEEPKGLVPVPEYV
jgi:DNA-binding CsgD family transcriptional regulator